MVEKLFKDKNNKLEIVNFPLSMINAECVL